MPIRPASPSTSSQTPHPSVRGFRGGPSCYHHNERTICFLVMSWWLLKIIMNQPVNPTRPVWPTQLPVEWSKRDMIAICPAPAFVYLVCFDPPTLLHAFVSILLFFCPHYSQQLPRRNPKISSLASLLTNIDPISSASSPLQARTDPSLLSLNPPVTFRRPTRNHSGHDAPAQDCRLYVSGGCNRGGMPVGLQPRAT